MWALERPWDPRPSTVVAQTPLALVAALLGGWFIVAWLVATEWLPASMLSLVAPTAMHGALLATALAWGAADGGVRLWPGTMAITVVLVGAGEAAAMLDARGAVVLLAVPAWLAVLAGRGRLIGLGLGLPVPLRPVLVGGVVGTLLGGHLLVSASQTLGYPLRSGGWAPLLVLWAHDVGVRVISAEGFFRGALFNRLQRRWSFGPAVSLATALSLVRYLTDPLLPGQVEVVVGALFYLTILGVVNCWLLWWSGSLVPGLLASTLFFFAYRAIAIG